MPDFPNPPFSCIHKARRVPLGEKVETALAVSLQLEHSSLEQAEMSLHELCQLIATFNVEVLAQEIIKVPKPNARFVAGQGKVTEVIELAQALQVDCIILDTPITPTQQRNWETAAEMTVISREEIILDIFAERATSKEAILQIELAKLQYMQPRLRGAWTHLSRQKGGTKGTRGEGETQIEVDRRIVAQRIAKLKKELQKLESTRKTQRKQRRSLPFPTGSIVGYTNAGKSSLLSKLSGAEVFIENKLFATLDPTTRRVPLPGGGEVLLTDTVGFIQNLPHHLIEAFASTLEESLYADFLIILADASDPDVQVHLNTTYEVLHSLGADQIPQILAFNKIDAIDRETLSHLRMVYPKATYLSTYTEDGLQELINRMGNVIHSESPLIECLIPPQDYKYVTILKREGSVITEEYLEDGSLRVEARVPKRILSAFTPYLVQSDKQSTQHAVGTQTILTKVKEQGNE